MAQNLLEALGEPPLAPEEITREAIIGAAVLSYFINNGALPPTSETATVQGMADFDLRQYGLTPTSTYREVRYAVQVCRNADL